MRVALSTTSNLSDVKKWLESKYGERINFRVCTNLPHALSEVTRGLHTQYPHKTALGYQTDGAPWFAPMIRFFSQEGFRIHPFSLNNQSAVEAEISKNGLFVISCEDDPILGSCSDFSELNQKLWTQKIFSVSISHSKFLRDGPRKINPFEAHILVIEPRFVVVVAGARVPLLPLLFGESDVINNQAYLAPLIENEDTVRDFETKAKKFCEAPLLADSASSGKNRLWDRAVLAFRDIDGEALRTEWLCALGLGSDGSTEVEALVEGADLSEAPNLTRVSSFVETTSGCRWNWVTPPEWLSAKGFSNEQIRGLLIIDLSLLNKKNLVSLEQTYEKIKALQIG